MNYETIIKKCVHENHVRKHYIVEYIFDDPDKPFISEVCSDCGIDQEGRTIRELIDNVYWNCKTRRYDIIEELF